MMAASHASPAQRTLFETTMPPREITATSLVPPPISTTMQPVGSVVGRPAPMAAAIGSSTMSTGRAPAWSAASCTARRSTAVTPDGMQMMTRARANILPCMALRMNSCNKMVVVSKSAMTPSFSGRTATMEPGVRPMTSFASFPTYLARSVWVLTATTDGSRMIIPFPRTYTRVFAVPRSIPISFVNMLCAPFCCEKYRYVFMMYRNAVPKKAAKACVLKIWTAF